MMHLKIAVCLLLWYCVALLWDALRSSEISLCSSLRGKSSQKTLISILFIHFLLPAYCVLFLLLIIAPTCFVHNSCDRLQGVIKFIDLYP